MRRPLEKVRPGLYRSGLRPSQPQRPRPALLADNAKVELGELKPLLTALVMPPALPLLGMGFGVVLIAAAGGGQFRKRLGLACVALAGLSLWLLSCHAVAVWLAHSILPQVTPVPPDALAQLRSRGAQAVVVLGGGVLPEAPEYQPQAQPNASTAERLRYGLKISRESGLPLGFAGGVGWASAGQGSHPTEAQAALAMAGEYQQTIRWLDAQSRDTGENARQMRALMSQDRIERVVLVTHAWHMPRSLRHFEQAGFEVIAAPMGFVRPRARPALEWLPTARGLLASQEVLREWLALRLMASRP